MATHAATPEEVAKALEELTVEDRAKYTKAFHELDKNGDGRITVYELKHHLRENGQPMITEREVKEMIASTDLDGNGTIELDELLYLMWERHYDKTNSTEKDLQEDIRELFEVFDIDKDGKLSDKELFSFLTHIGKVILEEDIDDVMREVDKNENGVVDFDEFVALMHELIKQQDDNNS